MGITGLLPLLKSIHKPCNLKKFAGQTIGVDAYGWLHRGTVGCAIDIALGKSTTKYVDFSLNRVRMLIHFGVTPYLVFDGDFLPSKAMTEKERAKRRDESRKTGLELYRIGKPSQAQKELQKAVDVTPEMAGQLIRELKKIGVQYVVAPYEADAQLAYLEKKGVIQGVLSEDSDLLVFGVKCLLTKLDQYGDCVEINRKDFTACRDISLVGWSEVEFRLMAILSGCDYLPSISNMGLLTAYRMVRKYRTLDKIIRMLQFDGKYYVPSGYREALENAILTFRHQRVFCPISNMLATVTDPDVGKEVEHLEFIGAKVESKIAARVAYGELHPMTKEPLRIIGAFPHKIATPENNSSTSTGVKFEDLKGNKSIKSFFKGKRTPLAELDPNSFTPSPSQQRLQQRASGGWVSSPAPEGPTSILTSRSEQTSTTPSIRRDNLRQPSLSAPQQALKRRRLCSDDTSKLNVSSPLNATGEAQSRFFTSRKPHSDFLKPVRQNRIAKTASINIWSDDSVEDVMANLPVATDSLSHCTPKKGPVTEGNSGQAQLSTTTADSDQDVLKLPCAGSVVQEESQTSISSNVTSLFAVSTVSSTSSIESFSQPVFADVDKHVKAELVALKEKYNCTASSENTPPMNMSNSKVDKCKCSQAPPTSLQTESEPPQRKADNLKVKPGEYQRALWASAGPQIKPRLTRAQSMTPLQRLGAHALNRSQSFSWSVDGTEKKVQAPSSIASDITSANAQDRVACPSPKLSLNKGSEDLIIPDSEEEVSGYSSPSDVESTGGRKLNLERFAFGG